MRCASLDQLHSITHAPSRSSVCKIINKDGRRRAGSAKQPLVHQLNPPNPPSLLVVFLDNHQMLPLQQQQQALVPLVIPTLPQRTTRSAPLVRPTMPQPIQLVPLALLVNHRPILSSLSSLSSLEHSARSANHNSHSKAQEYLAVEVVPLELLTTHRIGRFLVSVRQSFQFFVILKFEIRCRCHWDLRCHRDRRFRSAFEPAAAAAAAACYQQYLRSTNTTVCAAATAHRCFQWLWCVSHLRTSNSTCFSTLT